MLHLVVLSIFIQKESCFVLGHKTPNYLFCFEFELLRKQPHWPLPIKTRKVLKIWILTYLIFCHICSLAHNTTDTDCWSHNGSSHCHVFATLKCQFLTNMMINQVKKGCVYIYIPFQLITSMMLLGFRSPLTAQKPDALNTLPHRAVSSPHQITMPGPSWYSDYQREPLPICCYT